MTIWATFKARLARGLTDNNRDRPTWSDDELLDYLNYALVTVAEHTAQTKVWTPNPALSVPVKTVILPTDLIKLGPVYVVSNSDEKLLRPQRRLPGQTYYALTGSGTPDVYYEWPEAGNANAALNFYAPLTPDVTLKVAFWGYWDEIATDVDALNVPKWMEEALDWMCRAHAMAKPGVQAARIRPYNTKQDSGGPEDNPALEMARYCRREYERIMANHPTQDRTGWESS